jgi:hypothetical protein
VKGKAMARKKYGAEEKRRNRESYLETRSGDLLTYLSMIGQGFESRLNLLAQIIRDKHDPSLGRYKERLLVDCIRRYIPNRFQVGDGFVVFPKTELIPKEMKLGRGGPPITGRTLKTTDHDLSKQLDIIIYDAHEHPCIFKDGDFVVLRPEAVKAIVEVKGVLTPEEIEKTVDLYIDYGKKFKAYSEICRYYRVAFPTTPSLLMMA